MFFTFCFYFYIFIFVNESVEVFLSNILPCFNNESGKKINKINKNK